MLMYASPCMRGDAYMGVPRPPGRPRPARALKLTVRGPGTPPTPTGWRGSALLAGRFRAGPHRGTSPQAGWAEAELQAQAGHAPRLFDPKREPRQSCSASPPELIRLEVRFIQPNQLKRPCDASFLSQKGASSESLRPPGFHPLCLASHWQPGTGEQSPDNLGRGDFCCLSFQSDFLNWQLRPWRTPPRFWGLGGPWGPWPVSRPPLLRFARGRCRCDRAGVRQAGGSALGAWGVRGPPFCPFIARKQQIYHVDGRARVPISDSRVSLPPGRGQAGWGVHPGYLGGRPRPGVPGELSRPPQACSFRGETSPLAPTTWPRAVTRA